MSSKFPRTGKGLGPGGGGAFGFSPGVRRRRRAKAATHPKATLTGVRYSILAEDQEEVALVVDQQRNRCGPVG